MSKVFIVATKKCEKTFFPLKELMIHEAHYPGRVIKKKIKLEFFVKIINYFA